MRAVRLGSELLGSAGNSLPLSTLRRCRGLCSSLETALMVYIIDLTSYSAYFCASAGAHVLAG